MTSSPRTALGATAPWRDVVVDGVRLAVDDAGAGPALVCLHAIGHGASDYRVVRDRFAPRHRVVALDWPGQGRSGDDHRPPSAARYAELAVGALDALGLDRVVLIGNSIGGAAAIRMAAARPERVRGLVLENPGGLAPLDRTSEIAISAMVRFFSAGARRAWWYPAAFALYYRLVLRRAAAAEQRRRIVAAGLEMAPMLRDAWRGFGAPESDIRDLATGLSCPILLAWAERDAIVQLRRSLPAIQHMPTSRLERFPAGHTAHLETPDAFVASLTRFLGELAASS